MRTRFSSICVAVSSLALGCSSAEDSGGAGLYSYGAADVEQAVLGTWTGSWTPPGGTAGSFTVELARPAGATTRPTCGSRELGTLGPACIDTSSMTLAGVLDVDDGSFTAAPISGGLTVPGTDLTELLLSLEGAGVRWSAEWSRGAWIGCRAHALDGTALAACTIDARAP